MLTFAIPFYSDRAYLEAAIDSVVAQTRSDWRVLVVDDHSPATDVEDLVRRRGDSRMRYVRNPTNLGMAGNWNRCLELCETRYVTLLHADDELAPDYMATVLPLMAAGASAAFCGARVIGRDGRPIVSVTDAYKRLLLPRGEPMRLEGERGLSALLRGNFIFCPTLCYDRDALGATRFDTRWRFVLDLDLVTRVLLDGHTILGTRSAAFRYRRHGDNATVHLCRSLVAFEEEVALWRDLSLRAQGRGWRRAAALGRKMRIVKQRLAFETVRDLARGDARNAARKAAFLGRIALASMPLTKDRAGTQEGRNPGE